MKKSIISAIAIGAIFCACPLLQSCADTSSQTTYTTSSDPAYGYNPGYGYAPAETTTAHSTAARQPEGVVRPAGSVAVAIVEAPFQIVGATLTILFYTR